MCVTMWRNPRPRRTAACAPPQRASILATIAGTVQQIEPHRIIRSGQELIVTVQRLKATVRLKNVEAHVDYWRPAGSWRTMSVSPSKRPG